MKKLIAILLGLTVFFFFAGIFAAPAAAKNGNVKLKGGHTHSERMLKGGKGVFRSQATPTAMGLQVECLCVQSGK